MMLLAVVVVVVVHGWGMAGLTMGLVSGMIGGNGWGSGKKRQRVAEEVVRRLPFVIVRGGRE